MLRVKLVSNSQGTLASVTGLMSKEIGKASLGVISKWKDLVFQKKFREVLSQTFNKASGESQLSRSVLSEPKMTPMSSKAGSTGIRYEMEMMGVPSYGYAQQYGRRETGGSKYFLVPAASKFKGRRIAKEDLQGFFKKGSRSTFMTRQEFTDSSGRQFKLIMKRRVGSAGIGRISRSYTKSPQAKKSLRQEGEVLFIAYPKRILGIPGRSQRNFGEKRPPTVSSPIAAQFGFRPFTGRDPSRWFDRAAIAALPHLMKQLNDQRTFESLTVPDAVGRAIVGELWKTTKQE